MNKARETIRKNLPGFREKTAFEFRDRGFRNGHKQYIFEMVNPDDSFHADPFYFVDAVDGGFGVFPVGSFLTPFTKAYSKTQRR